MVCVDILEKIEKDNWERKVIYNSMTQKKVVNLHYVIYIHIYMYIWIIQYVHFIYYFYLILYIEYFLCHWNIFYNFILLAIYFIIWW